MRLPLQSVRVALCLFLAGCTPQQQFHAWLVDEVNAKPVPGASVAILIPGQDVYLDASVTIA